MPFKLERHFGYLFAAVFVIVAFWPLWPLTRPNLWWLGGSVVWLVVALIRPQLLAPLYRGWMKFGHVLGWINARIILGLVFFVMVMPIGLIMRLFGKDPLRMKLQKSASYWIQRGKPLDPQSLRNQF